MSGWRQVFKIFLYALMHTSISVSLDSDAERYPWTQKLIYYYPSVDEKMKDILSPDCSRKLSILKDGLIQLPSSNATINVASMPVKNEIMEWWKSIQRPNQMRVDPNLCDSVYTKRKPIFNGTGCQLQGYMHPSAPRCQNKYLKYVCDQSQIPIDESNGNAFVLPESDHRKTLLPPQPWLLTARNSFVSMCGTISTDCGLIHTLSNCQGTSLKHRGSLFLKKCASAQMNNVRTTHAYYYWPQPSVPNIQYFTYKMRWDRQFYASVVNIHHYISEYLTVNKLSMNIAPELFLFKS